jgi:penicillin-binding protein 2
MAAYLTQHSGASLEGRIRFAALLVVLVFAGFVFRVFHLQLVEGDELRERSEKNSVRTVHLEAPRGEVLDREGRVIATWRPSYALRVIPNDLAARRERTFAALGQLLERPGGELEQHVGPGKGAGRFRPVTLAEDLDSTRLARVEEHRYALPGVETFLRPRRYYPSGAFASHLLGSIGEISSRQLERSDFEGYRAGEVVGQTGLEAVFERHLRGRAGGRNVVVDAAGREVESLAEVAPAPGGRVVLALDWDLQDQAERGFREVPEGEPERMGSAVAIDVRSGDVLAMASYPTYDPNVFSSPVDAATWTALTQNEWHPLNNRAIQNHYPPGSTHKAFVAAAALAEGAIDLNTRVFCPGYYYFGGRAFRCWKKEGHGSVNVVEALQRSCDVFFYTVGVKIGIDAIAKHGVGFGLGQRSGINLAGESPGILPSTAWKRERFKQPWYPGETVSASIGQSYNVITPLQLAVGYATIANGGKRMRPRLVLRLEDRDGKTVQDFAPEQLGSSTVPDASLAIVRRGLTAVVEETGGTGGRARVPGVKVAGKTGTVQVVSLSHTEGLKESQIPIRFRDHAWFAAFAPADAPEIAVAVFVEHGLHGSSSAAPIAQRILAKYFEKTGRLVVPPPRPGAAPSASPAPAPDETAPPPPTPLPPAPAQAPALPVGEAA